MSNRLDVGSMTVIVVTFVLLSFRYLSRNPFGFGYFSYLG